MKRKDERDVTLHELKRQIRGEITDGVLFVLGKPASCGRRKVGLIIAS
jgi:hypothetical protein